MFDDDHRQHLFKVGYRWYDEEGIEPQYAFGYGLSYSKFEYSNLQLSSNEIKPREGLDIQVDIKNVGELDGDEVAQLYLRDLQASVKMPLKQLKGFERVQLRAGEKKTIDFHLSATDMSFWNEQLKKFFVEQGEFKLMIGGASDNLVLGDVFKVQKNYLVPDYMQSKELIPVPYNASDDGGATKPDMYKIKAENMSNKSMCVTQKAKFAVLGNGDWICFESQDLGSWLNSINLRAGVNHHNSVIKIHLDKPNGKFCGEALIIKMADLYKTKTAVIGTSDYGLSGVHDIYLKHINENEPDALCSILWIEWEQ